MSVTDRFYGSNTMGSSRPIQDFGLCDLTGSYVYTAKLRAKGLLVVVFFSPLSPPSLHALQTVQGWIGELPTQKWTALAVTEGDRNTLADFVKLQGLDGVSLVIDHELYQTRAWGVSHLPSIYLVDGKTGRVLQKVLGDDSAALAGVKQALSDQIAKIVAAEEAARKAEEEKKAAEAAAKA